MTHAPRKPRPSRPPGRATASALAVVASLAIAGPASAQPGAARSMQSVPSAGVPPDAGARARSHGPHTDLFVAVPLEGPTPGVVFPFGGSHHQVPGVVAVDRAPYVCMPHHLAFHDRAAFVAHLRRRHGLDDADIPRAVLVQGGQVRYVGD